MPDGMVENTGTGYTGTDVRVYGYAGIQIYGYKISIFSKQRLMIFYNSF